MTETKKARKRKVRPPLAERGYRMAEEVAAMLGCSKATVQRLSNGEVEGYPRLPWVPRGVRARVWMADAVERWLEQVQAITGRAE